MLLEYLGIVEDRHAVQLIATLRRWARQSRSCYSSLGALPLHVMIRLIPPPSGRPQSLRLVPTIQA